MIFKAVICDLDGTLLNTLEDIADSCNYVLEVHGYPTHPVKNYKNFVGEGARVLLERALPHSAQDENNIKTCLADFRHYYADHCTNKTHVYDGIIELLKQLTKRGLRIAVLTNKPQLHAEKCIKKYLNDCAIEFVIGQGNKYYLPLKPDTAGAMKIALDFNLPPEKILYLGDTAIDMKTACLAGMIPVGVTWGFSPVEELQDNDAEHIIEKPSEIMKLLD